MSPMTQAAGAALQRLWSRSSSSSMVEIRVTASNKLSRSISSLRSVAILLAIIGVSNGNRYYEDTDIKGFFSSLSSLISLFHLIHIFRGPGTWRISYGIVVDNSKELEVRIENRDIMIFDIRIQQNLQ